MVSPGISADEEIAGLRVAGQCIARAGNRLAVSELILRVKMMGVAL
jgi:hypothetical protein